MKNKGPKKIVTKREIVLHTFFLFSIFSIFLFSIDFVPERHVDALNSNVKIIKKIVKNNTSIKSPSTKVTTTIEPEIPIRIVISSIDLDTPIITPKNTYAESLDRALLSGAVHYPESALLGKSGNILLFGHSSYLPIIKNKAFKAFNGLNKLNNGDLINVYSEKKVYTYEVISVKHSTAKDVSVEFDSNESVLTLSTCDNFGNKEDRWVVTAKLSLQGLN